jgi:DNA-binding GntR family transcriptional regulator
MPDAPYRRVADEIRRRIATGAWPPGYQIPSQAALADELGVSRAEARRGMSVVRRAGLLEGTPRSRLYVAHPPAVRTLLDPDANWPYPTGDGTTGSCLADDDLAARLEVPPGTDLQWHRIDCLDPDYRPSHLIATWWQGRRPSTWARSVAEAELHQLTSEEAEHLGLASGIPTWRVMRTRYNETGRPIETADLVLPADRWRIRLA